MADQQLDDFLGVKPQPAWRRHFKWVAIVAGALLLILLAWRFFGNAEAPGYVTAPVQRSHLVTTVSATGKLAPTNQVTVGSQLSGLVVRVLVDVNDRVTQGQPLAEIDPEQIEDQIRQGRAQLAANQAQVAQAKATLSESQAQLARLEEVARLSGGRVPSKTELQTGRANVQRAQAALRVAEANVVASQAALSQNQTQRARAIIRSPVAGVVLARQVDPGQTVAASFNTPTLFVIAEDLSKMKLEVAIDEADVGTVKEGQKATFIVDAFPERTFPAVITRVDIGSNLSASAASASSTSSTSTSGTTGQVVSYAADLSVDNEKLDLRPGMTATADIVTSDKKDVLLVPNAALRFSPQAQGGSQAGGGQSGITGALSMGPRRRGGGNDRSVTVGRGAQQQVYVLGDDGKPKAVQITTGDTDGFHTEVLSGDLKPGMNVITSQLSGAASSGR
ncbi:MULTISPECIES: efflux RND transporter periplasmic adaptor subunit [Sphingobium]|uniref:efflux RND transporter periplasmic adaptor subunit n=1 Tax=Sphingobium TaxID=165695 RepID=UPI0015EB674D|nr:MULTISPECIES: efflux RND transporter periplasmic adaptor subunit [Sphingobium]MCW2364450.1 HlyD family secretion protein [Sphingobium sp. B10D3B]MCW2387403.1 HlyD family secretion protein [Sphingobium sp. B11D3B]MCW2402153.1 HlyD family secretion protein [Sphingobium sp. B10D7B]MCW2409132.1 HlyD family secretion protein [Sphingobium xanthum]